MAGSVDYSLGDHNDFERPPPSLIRLRHSHSWLEEAAVRESRWCPACLSQNDGHLCGLPRSSAAAALWSRSCSVHMRVCQRLVREQLCRLARADSTTPVELIKGDASPFSFSLGTGALRMTPPQGVSTAVVPQSATASASSVAPPPSTPPAPPPIRVAALLQFSSLIGVLGFELEMLFGKFQP